MLARVEFDGEERVKLAYAHGKGVLFVTGHFGFWELQAMVHAVRMQPITMLARALDNPHLERLLEHIRQRTGNTVVYRRGTIRRVMRTLQAGQGVAVLIDQHIMSRDADLRGLLRASSRHDVGGGGARAADRRARRAGVRAAARRRTLSHGLRASRRAAARRLRRRGPRVHAALHRRPRDVRPPASGPVAVDAPPLAREWRGGRSVPGLFPLPIRYVGDDGDERLRLEAKGSELEPGTLDLEPPNPSLTPWASPKAARCPQPAQDPRHDSRAAIGIRHPVPNARSVTFSPGAACLRLNSAIRTSRSTRSTVARSKPAATISSAG